MDPTDLETINANLDEDAGRREKIKNQVTEFDKKVRIMVGTLDKIHSTPIVRIPKLIASVRPTLESCSADLESLAKLIPPYEFWRWREMWCHSLRSAVFAAALLEYLESGKLVSLPETSLVLGFKEEWKDNLYLPVEDYLHGIISLVNELSRLAVNAVTMGDFEHPIRISGFVNNVFAGFSMLNLKNNDLRKRFDSLKYDIKKIEGVVYDISLRKLAPPAQKAEVTDSGSTSSTA